MVASLIDRAPNLGGLSRTCEIFGAGKLIVNNKKIINDKGGLILEGIFKFSTDNRTEGSLAKFIIWIFSFRVFGQSGQQGEISLILIKYPTVDSGIDVPLE